MLETTVNEGAVHDEVAEDMLYVSETDMSGGEATLGGTKVQGMEDAVGDGKQELLSEHREALSRMRAAMALDMLIEASGARDADIIRTLLSVDVSALARTAGADGVPDTRAVREKLARLKRDCGYLFMRSDSSLGMDTHTTGGATTGIMLGGALDPDDDTLSDEDYYKKHYNK